MASTVVGKLAFIVTAGTKGFMRGMGRVSKRVTGMGSRFARTAAAVTAGGLGFNAALGAADLVGQAANADALSNAFESMSKGIGANANSFLPKLRKATKGAVSDLDLMQASNNAMLLGVAKSEDDFAKMAQGARRLGKAMGRSPVEALNDIVIGVGRQSKLILDNLGLIVGAQAAYDAYAKKLGTTAIKLTDAQKKQAFFNAALDAMDRKLKTLGPDFTSTSESVGQFTASLKNAFFKFAVPALKFIAPLLTGIASGVKKIADLIMASFGEVGLTMANSLHFLDRHADKVGIIVDIYFTLKATLIAIAGLFTELVSVAASAIRSLDGVFGIDIDTERIDAMIAKLDAFSAKVKKAAARNMLQQMTTGKQVKRIMTDSVRAAVRERMVQDMNVLADPNRPGVVGKKREAVTPDVKAQRMDAFRERQIQSIKEMLQRGQVSNEQAEKTLRQIEVHMRSVKENTAKSARDSFAVAQ